jgi:hypothetical protein
MPPHIHVPKSPHGWRDILVDIAIITVGVLIALFGEQLISRIEWDHKANVAEAAMSRELLWDNGPQIYQRAAMHQCLVDQINKIREAVETGKSRKEITDLIAGYHLDFVTFDSLALTAANSADVAPHISADELNAFLDAYSAIPMMDRVNAAEAADLARLRALKRTGGALSYYETAEVLAAVEALRNDEEQMWEGAKTALPSIARLDGEIDQERTAHFMARAREKFGDCVKELPPGWSG